jgi:hypothetical protein
MVGRDGWRRSSRRWLPVTPKRLLLGASVVTGILVTGVAGASADTHTGFTIELTCGSTPATIVSPTNLAAAGQDINGTGVYVLAVGAYLRPNQFPAGKVMVCDLHNLTTGGTFTDLPFLVRGAP